MESTGFAHWLVVLVELVTAFALLLLALAAVVLAVTWVVDRNQTGNAVLRNFPVVGHFRYWFLHLGEFFRQYLYSSDREEMPFNRAQRTWVYRAAKNVDNTNAFGSSRDLRAEGVPFFVNAPFPDLGMDHVEPVPVTIGPYAREPYSHAAFFNISAMSFGALSAPAVRALSRGAAKAGIWMDTGEGGLAPYHLEGGCDIIFEIGTAKYGVRTPDGRLDDGKLLAICEHPQVKMVSIKLGQGAKPGMGGLLPGAKVTAEIAAIRGVTAEEIPAGKSSEEVIGAAITAGNAPCLIFNTAPAAVPQFQKQGGLVALDTFPGAADYLTSRTGKAAAQYASPDGKFYQIPWKSNPVMIFYNKDLLQKAGVDPSNPPLRTYDEFLATSRKVVQSKAAQAAIWPAPTSEFFQSWFDFYPLYAAESGGKQLVEGGKATFTSAAGQQVAKLWATMYAEGLAPKEAFSGDAFGTGKSAMAIVGPWAIAAYKDVKWGVAPVPTSAGLPAEKTYTFSDAKNIGLYSSCTNRATAWDLAKFATSKEQDGKLLETTGQMPLRADLPQTYPAYFAARPEYKQFADQAARTVEVPNVPNSIAIWQTFRDAYSSSVIFAKTDPTSALAGAADKIAQLAGQP